MVNMEAQTLVCDGYFMFTKLYMMCSIFVCLYVYKMLNKS